MKIKSYYSHSVEEAMASARQELGADAMLVNTRKAPPEVRHLGDYEVVFATLAPDRDSAEGGAAQVSVAASTSSSLPGDRLSVEVSELKKELEGMRRALTRTAYAPSHWSGVPQDVSDAYAALTSAEVSPELAREIVQSAGSRQGRGTPQRGPSQIDGAEFQRALVEELESRFNVDPALGRNGTSPRIVALVGPPGSGKTTTLVKLAVAYGLAARRGVVLLSMDTHRVAAADQLRSYAAILGVGFQLLETVVALAQAIEENRAKDLIFIDTPGLTTGELADEATLARFLAARADVDTHLVLPASMKPADLRRVVDAFSAFSPNHFLFTRLDETGSWGPIFNEAARTGNPLSFFTTGQRIPEDLQETSRKALLDLILAGHGDKAKSAA